MAIYEEFGDYVGQAFRAGNSPDTLVSFFIFINSNQISSNKRSLGSITPSNIQDID